MLTDLESEQIECTTSTSDFNKFAQVVCAFSNDLPNTAQNGYLLIGVNDNGSRSGLKATDQLLQSIGGLRSDGNILPQPVVSVSTFSFKDGDVVVVEVQPSPFPPVRYNGRTYIRVGPRKAIANEMEERILTERRATNVSTFDVRPSMGNKLDMIDIKTFKENYLSRAIDEEILKKDDRSIEEQLASLRFYSPNYGLITNAGLLLFGKDVKYHLPGAYIRYVKFDGLTVADHPINEKVFTANLFTLLPEIDRFLDYAIIMQKPVPVSTLREETRYNFPKWAIRELLMNAIMHRDYESNAPIKFYQFKNRVEIVNPGGLYGNARPENFPNVNDYRNPVVAESMKVLGYVNQFNRGIARVKLELKDNGNPAPIFDYDKIGVFGVTVFSTFHEDVEVEKGSGKSSENTREKIIGLINENPQITISKMAEIIGITNKGIEKQIKILRESGLIERQGSSKFGTWKVKK
ncbi:MAG: DUF977 family protein [Cytophagales bacterium]|nr:DUF977 family protein [Cytophagales bacterium]